MTPEEKAKREKMVHMAKIAGAVVVAVLVIIAIVMWSKGKKHTIVEVYKAMPDGSMTFALANSGLTAASVGKSVTITTKALGATAVVSKVATVDAPDAKGIVVITTVPAATTLTEGAYIPVATDTIQVSRV